MTTPTITVGCSFSVPDYFDNTFIISYPSCVVRDLFQMHMRARTIKNNKIYFSLPDPKTYNFIKCYANIKKKNFDNYDNIINYNFELHKKLIEEYKTKLKNNIYSKSKYIQNEIDKLEKHELYYILKTTETPEDMKQIKKYNLLEEALNGKNYKYMFFYFLKRCNYKIIDENNEEIEDIEKYKDVEKFKEDYIISCETAQIIEENKKNKQATENEKLKLDRYYFYNFLGSPPDLEQDIFNKLYIEMWQDKFKRSNITNTKNEILQNIGIKTIDDITNKTINYIKEDADNKIFRLTYIEEVKKRLNINYSFDNVTITRENINNCLEYLTEKRQDIYNVFNISDKDKGKTDLNFKKTLEFINMMFNNWNCSQIIGDVKTKDRKGIFKSYVLINKQIEALKTDFNINILDIFKPKEEENEDTGEDDENEEINYINYCFDNFDNIDNIE